MTPPKAVAAMEDLVALAKAIASKTLEADTKAFVAAAKQADIREAAAMKAEAAAVEREATVAKREKSCESRTKTLAADRSTLAKDRADWRVQKDTEQAVLRDARTQLDVAVRAVKEREDRAQAQARDAQSAMEKAQKIEREAIAVKADYEGRVKKIRALAS